MIEDDGERVKYNFSMSAIKYAANVRVCVTASCIIFQSAYYSAFLFWRDIMRRQESVKTIGPNGQISLGKQFAGRQVVVEQREPGVWLVRTATIVPDNERWLHEPQAAADLAAAVAWAADNPPSDESAEAILRTLNEQA
jgi:hypothetical protein